jgi:hypothetical protein
MMRKDCYLDPGFLLSRFTVSIIRYHFTLNVGQRFVLLALPGIKEVHCGILGNWRCSKDLIQILHFAFPTHLFGAETLMKYMIIVDPEEPMGTSLLFLIFAYLVFNGLLLEYNE